MQIIKIYGSLLDPIIALNKLFENIAKTLNYNQGYPVESNNRKIQKILNQNKVLLKLFVVTGYMF